jgi:hypothetical protein
MELRPLCPVPSSRWLQSTVRWQVSQVLLDFKCVRYLDEISLYANVHECGMLLLQPDIARAYPTYPTPQSSQVFWGCAGYLGIAWRRRTPLKRYTCSISHGAAHSCSCCCCCLGVGLRAENGVRWPACVYNPMVEVCATFR